MESIPALEALDEILVIGGLDPVLIGPHDLTCSLGIPEQYKHPLFIQSVETVIRKTLAQNIGIGIHMWDAAGADQEILWAKAGANLITHNSDILLFNNALTEHLEKIKRRLKLE